MAFLRQPLDIYLRTYIGGNVHAASRVGNMEKPEVVLGCARSLAAAVSNAEQLGDIRVYIVDDHSPEDFQRELKKIFSTKKISFEFHSLPKLETGNSASFRNSYRLARETARTGLIYFVEDDYLHAPSSIAELLETHELLRNHFPAYEIALVPVDEADNYGRLLEETDIVLSRDRYFRTVTHSTGTLLLTKKLLLRAWSYFMAFSLYGILGEVSEGSTINRIWKLEKALLFAPIPTLAIHVQQKEQISPYIHWEVWWKKYALVYPDSKFRGTM